MRAHNYRSKRGMVYTRKEYIKGTPNPRIVKFTTGTQNDEYDAILELKTKERVMIRDIALEAMRVTLNRNLARLLGEKTYQFTIVTYPHHVLRENRMMTGAGADRLQEGMRRGFGKIMGRAADLKKDQPIIAVKTFKEKIDLARKALITTASKVPKGAYVAVVDMESEINNS